MSKNKIMSIRISEDQDFLLGELGGHTKGFELMYLFFLDNHDMAAEFETRQKMIEILKTKTTEEK